MRDGSSGSALGEFERIYRGNVGAVTSYFARRCTDPQTVADLTSATIVRAAAGFGGFDLGRGPARAWLLGIAGHVYAQYCGTRPMAGMRSPGWLGSPSFRLMRSIADRQDRRETRRRRP